MASLTEELAEEAKQDSKQMVADIQRGAYRVASDAQAAVSEAMAPLGRVERNFEAAIAKSAREQPTATLGLAVALGFVLGALWRA